MRPDLSIEEQPILYWRKGEKVQNFGDFLSSYLFEELFLPIALHAAPTYLIGSVIADFLIPVDTAAPPSVVFWGCGARDDTGLSAETADKALILAVRGPLSASALKVGATVPQGDPALLLPALYAPQPHPGTAGRTVCIPHFWDSRSDADQLALSGCEQVLRPNLPNTRRRLLEMVDAIAASDFVLSASLHGAIVAAAYGRPFAFWDNGHLDVPFKWRDTAAMLSVPPTFATDLGAAQRIYREQIAPALRIPSLSPLLFNAPFPVRPEAALRVLAYEAQGDAALQDRLMDWSRRLAAGGAEVAAGMELRRQEIVQANRRASASETAAEAARGEAQALGQALVAAQTDTAEARAAAALARDQRDDAERRAAEASERLRTFSSDLVSEFDLLPDLEPRMLVANIRRRLEGVQHGLQDALAEAARFQADLAREREEAALKVAALAEATEHRDDALQRLSQGMATEVRLREALRSATVRREYEQRFVTAAKDERRAALAELEGMHLRLSDAVSRQVGCSAEIVRWRAETDRLQRHVEATRARSETLRAAAARMAAELERERAAEVELAREIQSERARSEALQTELASLEAATTLRAMRWLARKAPPPEGLKRALRAVARRLSEERRARA